MGPWPVEEVEHVLRMVQGFDPIGVAARDLQECMLLQLRHLGLEGTPAEKHRHRAPARAAEPSDPRDLAQARDLDRRPQGTRRGHPASRSEAGSRFNPSQSQYVTPDVYVEKIDDEYVVWLNEDGLPQMRISPTYRRLLDKARSTAKRRAPTCATSSTPRGG